MGKINQLFAFFSDLAKTNQVFAGFIGVYGLGVITFLFRNIPTKILSLIKEQLTTTLTVSGRDAVYYDLMRWLSKNKVHSYVRNLSFNNSSRWGSGDAMLTYGPGVSYFRFDGHLIKFGKGEPGQKSPQSGGESESIESCTLTVFGRNHKVFRKLFEVIQEKDEEINRLKVHLWKGYWSMSAMQHRRGFETVAIPVQQKDEIITHIDNFLKDKQFRIENGIPFRTGILLMGPPGTGKTSLIKAVCAYLKKDLYLLTLNGMNDAQLRDALTQVPEGAVVAIEDVDTAGIGKRKIEATKSQKNQVFEVGAPPANTETPLTLSGVLNAIDGPASGEGHILIATTNCPESLDEALVRDGRFDLKLNIGYMTTETFSRYMNRMYSGNWPGYGRRALKSGLTAARLQTLVMKHRNDPAAVLREVTEA
jgi:chaperone BCS1